MQKLYFLHIAKTITRFKKKYILNLGYLKIEIKYLKLHGRDSR